MTALAKPKREGNWRTGNDLTGTVCNMLTVEEQVACPVDAPPSIRGTWWRCRCRCGNEVVLPRNYIVRKQTVSCGCTGRVHRPRKPYVPAEGTEPRRKRNLPPGLALNFEGLAETTTCYACKEEFEKLSQEWRFKSKIGGRMRWFCSWRCYRKTVYNAEGFKIIDV